MLRGVARALGLTGAIGLFAFLPAPCWAALPTVVQVVPASGGSAPDEWVSFTATYRDSDGWKDLAEVRFLINRRFTSPAKAVYLRYNCRNNRLYLMNDRLTASLGGFSPGSAHVIENSQGRLDTAGTTVSGSGQTLTVTWRVSFKPAFAGGPYATSLWAQDRSRSTPILAKGTWTVDSTAPTINAVNPADGATYAEADLVPIRVSASGADGDSLEYQFLIDGVVKRPWGPAATWTWDTAGFPRQHQLRVQVRDPYRRQAEKTQELFGYRKPRRTP